MNRSPRHERSADCLGYMLDYQQDFTQFLEEARKNSCKVETSNATNDLIKQQLDGESLKKRKSWKNSLFSWLKKNNKPTKQATNGKPISSAIRRGHVSGPLQGNGGGITNGRSRTQRAASGPLTSLFSANRKVLEDYNQLPYMCLEQIDSSQKLHSYGPVYLVT